MYSSTGVSCGSSRSERPTEKHFLYGPGPRYCFMSSSSAARSRLIGGLGTWGSCRSAIGLLCYGSGALREACLAKGVKECAFPV